MSYLSEIRIEQEDLTIWVVAYKHGGEVLAITTDPERVAEFYEWQKIDPNWNKVILEFKRV